mmetsp:Transcript_21734/g.40567  ORF Transcript_21734/g.40567 Transcript_21734/m.40567 type:complete len:301 (+) Transcript_21734:159-1061(+)
MSSRDELETSHKKTLKSLEGEQRAAIKKAKGMKGKKGKEALAAVEQEYAEKIKALEASYQEQLAALDVASLSISAKEETAEASGTAAEGTSNASSSSTLNEPSSQVDDEAAARERKLAKARKKRDRQKEKEAKLQEQIEEETANAGPSMRQVELEQIQAILTPQNLAVREVEADGHCLYRAVAAQSNKNYAEIRALCADTLLANQEEFAPFCEYTDEVSSFDQYVEIVRNSAEWGGHLELRALGMALDRPIHVYSAQSGKEPLAIHEDHKSSKDPIMLSYHLHYYALGEHYNEVVKAKKV